MLAQVRWTGRVHHSAHTHTLTPHPTAPPPPTQATGALKTQDTTLQKLRTEVLSLHDTVDKHDAAMAAVDAQHKRALSSRDTEVTSARAQLAEAHAELSKVQAKAKDAAHAADAALSAVQVRSPPPHSYAPLPAPPLHTVPSSPRAV